MTEDEKDKNRDRLAKRIQIVKDSLIILSILTGSIAWLFDRFIN